MKKFLPTSGGRIFFVSTRRGAAGEELTLDYNIAGDNADLLPCSCGAAKCRGNINQKSLGVEL